MVFTQHLCYLEVSIKQTVFPWISWLDRPLDMREIGSSSLPGNILFYLCFVSPPFLLLTLYVVELCKHCLTWEKKRLVDICHMVSYCPLSVVEILPRRKSCLKRYRRKGVQTRGESTRFLRTKRWMIAVCFVSHTA